MSEMTKRLEEVEVKLAFQEDLVAKLDEVLTALRGEVEELRRDVRAMSETVERLSPDEPDDDAPPHY